MATATEAGPTGGALRFTRTGDTGIGARSGLHASPARRRPARTSQPLSRIRRRFPKARSMRCVAIAALDDSVYELSESVMVTR